MKLFAIPLLAVVLAQGDDAAKTFQAMEAKIARAKSVQVTFEASAATPKGTAKVTGSLASAGDRVRFEFALDADGKSMKLLSVSDGKKSVTVQDGKVSESKDTPHDTGRVVTALVARAGFTPLFFSAGRQVKEGDKDRKEDPLEVYKASDFKLGQAEKVGGRDTVAIDYKLTLRDDPPLSATVWLDAKTHLPLKRVVRNYVKGGGGFTITETYSTLTLDPRLDAKLFEFPK
jgi:outer membrane lipoprotein-sorting protein